MNESIYKDGRDRWLDKGNGITTVYLRSGIAINIPTIDFMTGWNSNKEIAETITKDQMICIGGLNKNS